MRFHPIFRFLAALTLSLGPATASLLYINGPLVTHPGGGAGGADASALQSALGMTTFGFSAQQRFGSRVADDFTVEAPGWTITSAILYGYQIGAPTSPSTFTGATLRIWDGPPGLVGSSVIWGDMSTNRLVSSGWSGIYRVRDINLSSTARPIMANSVSVGITLGPGTYWLDWDFAGSPTYTGPWVPPVTILRQTSTGNARMYFNHQWEDIFDEGLGTPQGLPFELYGTMIPEPSTFGLLAVGLGALGLARRRRSC